MNSLPPPQASRPPDVYTRVAFFTQLPDYQGYLAGLRALPPPPEGVAGLHWNLATPGGTFYDQALPSYLAQLMQSQTPLGSGGSRRAAPSRPKEETASPVAPATRPRQKLPEVLDPSENAEAAARSLAVRLLGDAKRRAALAVWEPAPEENQDSLHWERLALYFVLARENSLRYNVDNGRFVRVYADGESREVLSMAWVCQVLRQGQSDRWSRVEQRLRHLPLDQHLFTPPPPPPPKPKPRPRPATPAQVAPGAAAGPVVAAVSPGAAAVGAAAGGPGAAAVGPGVAGGLAAVGPSAAVGTAAGGPGAAAGAPVVAAAGPGAAAFGTGVAAGGPGATAGGSGAAGVTVEPGDRALSGGEQPVSAAPPVPTAPLSLKIHRYWDLAAGGYSEVSSVRLEGSDGQDEAVENGEGKPWLALSRNLPVGSHWRITITWANGVTRSWEQTLGDLRGSDREVFSPDG